MKEMRRFVCVGLSVFVLLILLIYGRAVLTNDFVEWDDGLLITDNPIVRGLSFSNIKAAFTSYDPELYIPLTILSYQIDYSIWGMNPLGFHLTNLLLHIGNALLVMWLLKMLAVSGDQPSSLELWPARRLVWLVSIFVGMLFAIHPLHTEAVVWASARKDVLSGFFFLLSLNLYLVSHKKWSLSMFVLACLSKIIAVILPVIFLLIDWKNGKKCNVIGKLPYFFISFVFIIIALFGKSGSHGLWWEKILIGTKATVFYLQKIFWPAGLSVLYPYTQPINISNFDLLIPFVIITVFTLILLTIYMFLSQKRNTCMNRGFIFGWLFFLLLLAPSFTNFAKGQDVLKDVYFASDRYAYLASIGIFFIIFRSIHQYTSILVYRTRCSIFAFFIFPVVALSYLSYHQSFVWNNTKSLFTNVVQYYPQSHVAYNNLGSLLYREGDTNAAIEKYKDSIRARPNSAAFFNLGVIYEEHGKIDIAKEAFYQAVIQNPDDEEARNRLEALGI